MTTAQPAGPSSPGAPGGAERWRDPSFLREAEDWLDERLADLGAVRTGPTAQPHVQPWATALRAPTSTGVVWLKAVVPSLRHEVVVTRAVADRAPDVVPRPLAAAPDRGWMLMADAGERLREVVSRTRSLEPWLPALAGAARVSLACEDLVPQLLEAGVPDLRLPALPAAFHALVRDLDLEPRHRAAVGLVEELCADLARHRVPDSVQHDDLHDGQVHLGADGHPRILDWGDACVTHPFLVLAVTLDGVIAWGVDDVAGSEDTARFRDAFLAPYALAHGLDRDTLLDAAATARRLGWACRAVNGHVTGDEAATRARLGMFLDGTP